MSVTTTSRVDATAPVLAHLVDAATKGFTGSLEVSARDASMRNLKVSIWLEDGAIYAVHADGWTPPAAAFVLFRTGYDFTGPEFDAKDITPFQAAYETLDDEGNPLMSAAELDVPRRDWAYGLLAASLTWTKPKIRRVKKVATDINRITPTNWQVVTADVAARVNGLESAWRVVCESLTEEGIRPVSAGKACALMGVVIDGHPFFTGAESLDEMAARLGLSRYVVLEELSRAILSGSTVTFVQADVPDVRASVPEHWEDPEHAWGWVDESPVAKLATMNAGQDGPVELETSVVLNPNDFAPEPDQGIAPVYVAPVDEPEAEPLAIAGPGHLFSADLGDLDTKVAAAASAEQEADPEPDEDYEDYEDFEPDAEPEPAPEAEPETPVEDEYEDFEPAAEPDPVLDADFGPASAGPADARGLINWWVAEASDEPDEEVRVAIVRNVVATAREQAHACAAQIAVASTELDDADAQALAAAQSVDIAQVAFAGAQVDQQAAEVQVAAARADVDEATQTAQMAADRAGEAEATADADRVLFERMLERVAEQEVTVAQSTQAALRASADAQGAKADLSRGAAPALAAAEAAAAATIEPATRALTAARQRSGDAASAAAAAVGRFDALVLAGRSTQALADLLGQEPADSAHTFAQAA